MTGVMNASLKTAGKLPSDSERLNISTMKGAMTSAICFSTDVGIGSAADCLSGSRRIASMTSSVVSGEKLQKDVPGRTRLNVGGGASLVVARTLATLSAKNWLNVSTSKAELAGTRPRPSRSSTNPVRSNFSPPG